MRNLLACVLTGAVLVGCGTLVSTSAVNVTPAVTEGEVTVDITRDKTTGLAKSVKATLSQPKVSFIVHPGSHGMTVHGYALEVLNHTGAPYGAELGSYTRSLSAVLPSGFACEGNVSSDSCSPLQKTAVGRTVSVDAADVLLAGLGGLVAQQCAASSCPTLQMKFTFFGRDANGAPVNVAMPYNATLPVRVASDTSE